MEILFIFILLILVWFLSEVKFEHDVHNENEKINNILYYGNKKYGKMFSYNNTSHVVFDVCENNCKNGKIIFYEMNEETKVVSIGDILSCRQYENRYLKRYLGSDIGLYLDKPHGTDSIRIIDKKHNNYDIILFDKKISDEIFYAFDYIFSSKHESFECPFEYFYNH